jgi:hypothetical protein
MRLLLDECVPRPLKRDLAEHDVHHVVDMGWSTKRNGELLQLMVEAGFEALLPVDRGIEFQQNIRSFRVGVVIVVVRRNRLKELRPLIAQVLDALSSLKAGDIVKVPNQL